MRNIKNKVGADPDTFLTEGGALTNVLVFNPPPPPKKKLKNWRGGGNDEMY